MVEKIKQFDLKSFFITNFFSILTLIFTVVGYVYFLGGAVQQLNSSITTMEKRITKIEDSRYAETQWITAVHTEQIAKLIEQTSRNTEVLIRVTTTLEQTQQILNRIQRNHDTNAGDN